MASFLGLDFAASRGNPFVHLDETGRLVAVRGYSMGSTLLAINLSRALAQAWTRSSRFSMLVTRGCWYLPY